MEGGREGDGGRTLPALDRLERVSKTYQVVDQSFGGVLQHMGEVCTAALAYAVLLLHPAPTQCRTCLGIKTRWN